jgi:hypothetical protein
MLGLTCVQMVRHVVRTDGTVDRWASGRDGTIVQTADRDSENFCLESSAESSDITLNSRIPWKTAYLHTSDFVQTQNEANNTNKLPLWPFWDKNHLTRLEIHSRSK